MLEECLVAPRAAGALVHLDRGLRIRREISGLKAVA
jgi:hypothetical protein